MHDYNLIDRLPPTELLRHNCEIPQYFINGKEYLAL